MEKLLRYFGLGDLVDLFELGFKILFINVWCAKQLYWLIKKSVLQLPLSSPWYQWVPLWILMVTIGYELFTKNKRSNLLLTKVSEYGKGLHGLIWKFKPVGCILSIFVTALPLMAYLVGFKTDIFLFLIFAAIANVVLAKIPWVLGYIVAGIVLLSLVLWRRFKEDPDEFTAIYRDKGLWKCVLALLARAVIPQLPKTHQVCIFCGHENPIDEKEGAANYCDDCRARNPEADWECKARDPEGQLCNTTNKGNRQFCRKCGTQNPFRDERGNPLPVRPDGSMPTAPEQPQQPPHTEPEENATDTVECPRCHASAPRADFCGECGFRFNLSHSIDEFDTPTN